MRLIVFTLMILMSVTQCVHNAFGAQIVTPRGGLIDFRVGQGETAVEVTGCKTILNAFLICRLK